jgi:hypothetical protein
MVELVKNRHAISNAIGKKKQKKTFFFIFYLLIIYLCYAKVHAVSLAKDVIFNWIHALLIVQLKIQQRLRVKIMVDA